MFNLLMRWCDSPSDTSLQENEHIIHLEIIQKEGCFASAKITIPNTSKIRKYVRIFTEKNGEILPMFFGKITSFPILPANTLTQIEAIAEPENYQQQLNQFTQQCEHAVKNTDLSAIQQQTILRDELFFSENDLKNPTTWLEGGNQIFYWDMKTGKLSLSSILKGNKIFKISKKDILSDSLKIKFAREPYGKVNVSISTSCIQKIHGFLDLIPVIANEFKLKKINSLTDISSSFKSFTKDGYSVVFRKIDKIHPNIAGILTNYPTSSDSVKINGHQPYTTRFRRFYFDGKFIISWNYHQKRKETVRFSIGDNKNLREKNIFINLNAIQLGKDYPAWQAYQNYTLGDKVIYSGHIFECTQSNCSEENFDEKQWKKEEKVPDALNDDSANSFFATIRGKNTIAYARQKAIALLNYSRRYVTIELCVNANHYHDITINDEVALTDFSNQEIKGKVIKTQLICNNKERLLYLTLGCASDQYIENISDPIHIDAEKEHLQIQDIVTDIQIENSPDEQLSLLASHTFDSASDAKNFLKHHATKIRLKLRPLSIKNEISKVIELKNTEISC